MKKQFKILIGMFLIGVLITGTFLYLTQKPNINQATIQEIEQCEDIGPILANDIYVYVQKNKINKVVLLEHKIKNIGNKRIEALKKKFR